MTYIVVGVMIWICVGFLVALALGKATKLAELHERKTPYRAPFTEQTLTRS